jgi:hypothetical protein
MVIVTLELSLKGISAILGVLVGPFQKPLSSHREHLQQTKVKVIG